MIYTELNEYDMQVMLARAERDNFSLHALRSFIQMMEDIGEDFEFDPVGFDCSYVEFDLSDQDDVDAFTSDYGYLVEGEEFDDENDMVEAIMNEIEQNTLVVDGSFSCYMFDYNF